MCLKLNGVNFNFIFLVASLGTVTCNFDSDYCQWIQSTTDQFNWSRINGSTSSQGTGPLGDHTSAGQSGYGTGSYIYIEASGRHTPGDKADLMTQIIPSTSPQVKNAYLHCIYIFSLTIR